jgi:hypothetical protein
MNIIVSLASGRWFAARRAASPAFLFLVAPFLSPPDQHSPACGGAGRARRT